MGKLTEIPSHALVFAALVAVATSQSTSICEASKDCKACISAHRDCVWCSDPSLPNETPRCMDPASTSNPNNCTGYLADPQSTVTVLENRDFTKPDDDTTGSNAIQMRPQRISLKLRKGQTMKVNVTFRKVKDYPLDLYYVMDLSNSMNDDLTTLKKLGASLLESIKENITENVQVGFGSFVDKVMMPFTSTVASQLQNPCSVGENASVCAPPFGFRHQLAITGNATAFQEAVQGTEVSGNIDIPEGSFDALMQIAVCEEDIKWRAGSTRVILLTTDATPHIAMDGKLAAILEANDMKCHLEKGVNLRLGSDAVVYSKSKTLDYPSLGQLKEAFTIHKVRAIFAVTIEVLPLYQGIPAVLKELGEVSELASDSRNIIPLIKTTYNKIKGRLVVRASDAPSHVTFTQRTYCHTGTINDEAMDCDNINLQDQVVFELSFTANECLNRRDQINVTSSSLTDVVTLDLEYICDCDCAAHQTANSSDCKYHGNETCGLCACETGREGSSCQCTSAEPGQPPRSESCRMSGSENGLCEGNGDCECGECKCRDGFIKDYCQCRTTGCPTSNDQQCGGVENGRCENCLNNPVCVCNPPYSLKTSDQTCTCHPRTCQAAGSNQICSGRGTCDCDKCVCDDPTKWGGKLCETCTHPDCTGISASCADPLMKACAECLSRNDKCDECPTDNSFILFNKRDSIPACDCSLGSTSTECKECSKHDSSISVPATCVKYYSDTCSYSYKMHWTTDDRFYVYVKAYNRETDCPKPVEPIVIILPTVGAIVLIGILLLVVWKIYTNRRDRIAWEEFEKAKAQSKWTQGDNPLFETPENKFTNPMFDAVHD